MLCGIGADRCRDGGRRPSTVRTAGRRPLLALVALGIAAALGGCGLSAGEQKAIKGFGLASKDLADGLTAGLVEMRTASVAANTSTIVNSPGLHKEPDLRACRVAEFEGALSTQAQHSPTGAKRPPTGNSNLPDAKVLAWTAQKIKAYGELLVAFATGSNKEELDKLSTRFASTLKKYQENFADPSDRLEDKRTTAVGRIFAYIIRQALEIRKRERILALVSKEQKDKTFFDISLELQQILGDERSPFRKCLTATFATARARAARQLRTRSRLVDRQIAALAYRDAVFAERSAKSWLAKAAKAANELDNTNRRLVRAMKQRKVTIADIKAFYQAAQELVGILRDLAPAKKGA